MWAEYEAVLRRPELKLQPSETDRTLTDLRTVAEIVSPDRTLSDSPAESDNRFLECATAGHADYLVTGNTRHFPTRHGETMIVSARELLERFSPGVRRE